MQYNKKYIEELETLVTDELLPAYIESCRRRGVDPNQNNIVKKLLKIMKLREEVPALLQVRKKHT